MKVLGLSGLDGSGQEQLVDLLMARHPGKVVVLPLYEPLRQATTILLNLKSHAFNATYMDTNTYLERTPRALAQIIRSSLQDALDASVLPRVAVRRLDRLRHTDVDLVIIPDVTYPEDVRVLSRTGRRWWQGLVHVEKIWYPSGHHYYGTVADSKRLKALKKLPVDAVIRHSRGNLSLAATWLLECVEAGNLVNRLQLFDCNEGREMNHADQAALRPDRSDEGPVSDEVERGATRASGSSEEE